MWHNLLYFSSNVTVEDCLYIVMDHCKGGNLAEKIEEQRESGGGFDENQVTHRL